MSPFPGFFSQEEEGCLLLAVSLAGFVLQCPNAVSQEGTWQFSSSADGVGGQGTQ